MDNFGLYSIITNPTVSPKKFAEACVESDVSFLQIREKDISDKELVILAKELSDVVKGSNTKLILNDRPDIAYYCGLDGYHLGQDDLQPDLIIDQFKKEKVVGLSTHTICQVKSAMKHKPDYIGFGPIYKTPTKKIPDMDTGTSPIKEVLQIADCPVVFIGGLFPENIEEVVKAGAKNICSVRYLMETDNPRKRIEELKKIIHNNRSEQ